MDLSGVRQGENGVYSASVFPGHADELLAALDPDAPYVLIETGDGRRDWHEAFVSVDPEEEPRPRLVRRHGFDVLVTVDEAVELGRLFRARGLDGGELHCFQFHERPSASFWVPGRENPRGRADALRGQGVVVAVHLPHNGEVAVVSAPHEQPLATYLSRLRAIS